jgi:hypothetical protein
MRLTGIGLVLLVPLLAADGLLSARGRFVGEFWASDRDSKLEHIARHRSEWAVMGSIWIAMLAVATAGITAFGVLLSRSGEGILASLGWGLFISGVVSMLIAVFFLFGSVGVAAEARRENGATPGWLEPIWAAANWAEVTYIVLSSLSYVIMGIGMVRVGYPIPWVAWASIGIGAVSVIGMVVTPDRVSFPQLPLLFPVVLGVALLIS